MASIARQARALKAPTTAGRAVTARLGGQTQQRDLSYEHIGKQGPGGYSSSSGVTCTVFGAYGFLGRYVVGGLAPNGTNCWIPYRGDDMEVRHLEPMGDYGKIGKFPFSPKDKDSIRRAVEGSDCVINLIGKDYETKMAPFWYNYTFDDVHVGVAKNVAEVAKEMGAKQMIHLSALAADKDSESHWASSKAHGEDAVRSAFPGATIVRPAQIFGDEDRFLNKIAQLGRSLPRFFLVDGGMAKTQPVYVNDVAQAISAMIQNPDAVGKTYDLAGPEIFSQQEVVEFVFQQIRRPPMVVDLPHVMYQAAAFGMEQLPNPVLTRDGLVLDGLDNTLADSSAKGHAKTFADLAMEPCSMQSVSIRFLHQYQMGGHFLETV